MKVSVAEDDPRVPHLLERLPAIEYEAVTARDGEHAMRLHPDRDLGLAPAILPAHFAVDEFHETLYSIEDGFNL